MKDFVVALLAVYDECWMCVNEVLSFGLSHTCKSFINILGVSLLNGNVENMVNIDYNSKEFVCPKVLNLIWENNLI